MSSLFQKLAYRKNKSKKQTGLCALSSIKKAVVIFDSEDKDAENGLKAMKTFFGANHIELKAYAFCFNKSGGKFEGAVSVFARNLDLIGCIGTKSKKIDRNTDMFISMFDSDDWLPDYEAACSAARFKIGRKQTKDKVYDFVLTSTEGKPLPQVFAAMTDILLKVK